MKYMETAIYTILLIIVSAFYFYKYNKLKKLVLPTECNNLLKEIIELSFNKDTLIDTSAHIVKVLMKKYNIDYCSILLKRDRGLKVISSNVDMKKAVPLIEQYANDLYDQLKREKKEAKIICTDTVLRYPTAQDRNIKYLFFIPLQNNRKDIGAILIECMERNNIESIEQNFFKLVMNTIAVVLQDFIYKDKLAAIAMTDGLTGLSNRACMDKQLAEQLQLHKKTDMPFTIALLDIDHFKKVNDTYGHLAGDDCLKKISGYLKSSMRNEEYAGYTDGCYRYGGEEILLFFSRVTNKDIINRIEDIREGISSLSMMSEKKEVFSVKASFGMSEYPSDGISIERLIELADQGLYYSKQNGRNRVTPYQIIKEG